MILTPENEYTVILDACVLAPMPLCDTLLCLAEEPALYRPLWSEPILQEIGAVLVDHLGRTPEQRDRCLTFMRAFFPEASVVVQESLSNALTCIPDVNDRHVLAAVRKSWGLRFRLNRLTLAELAIATRRDAEQSDKRPSHHIDTAEAHR